MKADTVNLDIRRHEELDSTNWEYSERAQELYRYFDLFNRRFFSGQLPIPVISFRPGRVSSLGWYRLGRNEVGIKDQINLNTRHLGLPRYVTLGTLLHEMAHEWQDYFGEHGTGYYHNKQFQAKTREFGIPSDSAGRTIEITDPFVEFCKRHGVDFSEEGDSFKPFKRPRGRSNLSKYNCDCMNIWAAKRVHARCELCGGEFKLAT